MKPESFITLYTKDIVDKISEIHKFKKKIGLCHGCFDLAHHGHLIHFEEAKEYCDYLVVSITADGFVKKGPGRPLLDQQARAHFLASLAPVDAVIICNESTALSAIQFIKPNFYFKGPDYLDQSDDVTGMIKLEEVEVTKFGGSLICTTGKKLSSTQLINSSNLLKLPANTKFFLDSIRDETSFDEVLHFIEDEFSSINISIIGDLIIDEYVTTIPVGTTSKSPAISTIYSGRELMLGGSAAIARHAANFANSIDLFCQKGGLNWTFDNLIESNIPSNLKIHWSINDNAYTPQKVRFFGSGYPNPIRDLSLHNSLKTSENPQKLFELAYLNNPDEDYFQLDRLLATNNLYKSILSNSDVVIFSDFGHGLLSINSWDTVRALAKMTLLNVQTNSTNFGFNLISKYKNPTYACIDELESRLFLSDRTSTISTIWKNTFSRINPKSLFITQGSKGMYCGDSNYSSSVPAFGTKIVDPVGAGDAVLAALALCMAAKAPSQITNLICSAFGALACEIVGNRESISKASVIKFIRGIY